MRAHAPTARRGVHAVTRGRVCTTDAAACGCKHDAPGVTKYLQATKLETWVRRPRRDGASGERSWRCETCSCRHRDACGLHSNPGLSPAGKRWRRGGVAEGLEDSHPRAGGVFGPRLRCPLGASINTSAFERRHRAACALRLFAHVEELGGREWLPYTPIVARSNCGRNGITWRDIKKSFRAPRRILPIYAGKNE